MGLTVSGRKNVLSTVNHQKCRLKLTISNFTVSAGYNGPSGYWKNQFPCKKKNFLSITGLTRPYNLLISRNISKS